MTNIPIFQTMPKNVHPQIAAALENRFYASGEFIFREGDEGDAFYIIKEGQCKVIKHAGKASSTRLVLT